MDCWGSLDGESGFVFARPTAKRYEDRIEELSELTLIGRPEVDGQVLTAHCQRGSSETFGHLLDARAPSVMAAVESARPDDKKNSGTQTRMAR